MKNTVGKNMYVYSILFVSASFFSVTLLICPTLCCIYIARRAPKELSRSKALTPSVLKVDFISKYTLLSDKSRSQVKRGMLLTAL
jgi:hypothetical protein